MPFIKFFRFFFKLLKDFRVLWKHRFMQKLTSKSVASGVSGKSDVNKLTSALVDYIVLAQDGLKAFIAL
jgi:hypothetical protein